MSNGPWGISMKKLGGQMLGCRWTKLLPNGHLLTNTAHTDRLLILPFVCMHAIVLKDANAGQDFETRSGDNNKDFIDIKSKE